MPGGACPEAKVWEASVLRHHPDAAKAWLVEFNSLSEPCSVEAQRPEGILGCIAPEREKEMSDDPFGKSIAAMWG